jgi:hypothetical protein
MGLQHLLQMQTDQDADIIHGKNRFFCPLKDQKPESKNTDPIGVGEAILLLTSDNVAHCNIEYCC